MRILSRRKYPSTRPTKNERPATQQNEALFTGNPKKYEALVSATTSISSQFESWFACWPSLKLFSRSRHGGGLVVGSQPHLNSRRISKRGTKGENSHLAQWLKKSVHYPYHPCMIYLPTWIVDFYGTIYHTWILYGLVKLRKCKYMSCLPSFIVNNISKKQP